MITMNEEELLAASEDYQLALKIESDILAGHFNVFDAFTLGHNCGDEMADRLRRMAAKELRNRRRDAALLEK